MKAIELMKRFVKPDKHGECGVIAIDAKTNHWFHVHNDEEVPSEKEYDIAIHLYPRIGG